MTLVTATVKAKTTVTASTNSVEIVTGADATVQLNGSTIGTVASGATGDFDVLQDSSPVGSWNGSAWIIPPDAGGGTLTIGVFSDAGHTTPITEASAGSTIYIRLTATGLTPTNYRFFTSNLGDDYVLTEQASQDLTYVLTSDLSIYAEADDGSIVVASLNEKIITASLGVLTTAFVAATGLSDATIINAYNDLETSCRADGLIGADLASSKIKALWCVAGGTATIHKYNFMEAVDGDAAHRLIFTGGITHDANGVTGNATNGIIDSFYNPLTEGLTNTSNALFYMVGSNAAGSYDFGQTNTFHNSVVRYSGNQGQFTNLNTSAGLPSSTDSIGFYVNTRTSSTLAKFFKDGVQYGSSATTLTTAAFLNMNLTMMKVSGDTQYSGKNFQMFGVSEGLTDADVTNLTAINLAFQTAVGR